MNSIAHLVLALSVLLVGKSFAEDPATALQVKSAFYSVPVISELAPFATFDMDIRDVQVFEGKDGLRITYKLPAEIMGPDSMPIHLTPVEKTEGTTLQKMRGQQELPTESTLTNVAEASCAKHPMKDKKLQCMIVYHSLFIDQEKVKNFLTESTKDPAALAWRLKVAAAFGNEPSGVLAVELE